MKIFLKEQPTVSPGKHKANTMWT